MNPSSGLGQPSPGQPDFNGPPSDGPRTDSDQPAWTSTGEGRPPGGGFPTAGHQPTMPGLPAQFGYAPTPGIASPEPGRTASPGPQYAPAEPSAGNAWPAAGPPTFRQPPPQQYGPADQPPYRRQALYPHTGQQPSGQQIYAPGGYPPPMQQPPGNRPQRPARPGRRLILAGGIIGLLIVGLLGWQLLAPRLAPQPTMPSSGGATASTVPTPAGSPQPTVVRASNEPQPTASSPVTGGGIGRSVDFKTTQGSGRVTVTAATWADNGIFEPADGSAYLILDLSYEGVGGSITTGPFFTRVSDANGDSHMMTIGASLQSQLTMRTLEAGEKSTGQVAFELKRGPVRFEVLDETLLSVAAVDIPG